MDGKSIPDKFEEIGQIARQAYEAARHTYADAPPVTGGVSTISVKKSLEACITEIERLLNTVYVELQDGAAMGSARLHFRLHRTDIEVWDKKGEKGK